MRMAGRFAPSPTGPLHLGSLYTALASFLDARSQRHDWLVRIDDLDAPRSVPQAESQILRALEAHGLHWDGGVRRQSEQVDVYDEALVQLTRGGSLYGCTCSRRQLRHAPRYPGTCRDRARPAADAALRVRVDQATVRFVDRLRGEQVTALDASVGDFIVRRRDGIVAYQLATALDDSDPAIARVVRGRDLLDNTPRQIYLMTLLGRRPPDYAHLPLLLNDAGRKLSKQTGARPIDASAALANLRVCLKMLGLTPLPDADIASLLHWATGRWELGRVPEQDHLAPPGAPA